MGNSVAKYSEVNPFSLSIKEWIELNNFSNESNVYDILRNRLGYSKMDDLYWAYYDLEDVTQEFPVGKAKADIRRSISQLMNYNIRHNIIPDPRLTQGIGMESIRDTTQTCARDTKNSIRSINNNTNNNNNSEILQESLVDEKKEISISDDNLNGHTGNINCHGRSNDYNYNMAMSIDDLLQVPKDCNFKLQVKVLTDKTRLKTDRPMLIGMFEKDRLSHASVRIVYFDKKISQVLSNKKDSIMSKQCLMIRIFIIELVVHDHDGSKEVILKVKGPVYDKFQSCFSKYHSKEYCQLYTSMANIIKLAKITMKDYTDYNLFFSNCRHFSQALIDVMKKRCNSNSCIDSKNVQLYIDQYFSDSFAKKNRKNRQKPKSTDLLDSIMSDDNKSIDNMIISHKYKTECLTFNQLKNDFNPINPNKIKKQGWLTKSPYTKFNSYLQHFGSASHRGCKSDTRYCVVTTNKKLYIFTTHNFNAKRLMPIEDISLDNTIDVKLSWKFPTRFLIGNFEFDCGNENQLYPRKFKFPLKNANGACARVCARGTRMDHDYDEQEQEVEVSLCSYTIVYNNNNHDSIAKYKEIWVGKEWREWINAIFSVKDPKSTLQDDYDFRDMFESRPK